MLVVAPSLLLTLAAVVVVLSEQWSANTVIVEPLDYPPVVDDYLFTTDYNSRLWGCYRYVGVASLYPINTLTKSCLLGCTASYAR